MSCCVREEEYTKLQKDVAKYAKAFGHPARVAILELLAKKCNCICNDLVEGIIKPPAIEYHLNVKKWLEAKKALKEFFEEWFLFSIPGISESCINKKGLFNKHLWRFLKPLLNILFPLYLYTPIPNVGNIFGPRQSVGAGTTWGRSWTITRVIS